MHTFKDPWRDCTDAFGPMFSDEVVFRARQGASQGYPVMACAFTEEQVDPFVEHDNESPVRLLTVLVPKREWKNPRPIQVGDTVEAHCSLWNVGEVEEEQDWYKVRARRAKAKNAKGGHYGT